MISLIDLLLEDSKGARYDYGCVMVYFNFPQLSKIQTQIKPEDIYTEEGDRTYGLESDPHCTLLYGLHEDVSLEDVEDIVNQYKFGPKPLSIKNASLFENEKFDVLKFDVNGEILYDINNELVQLPHTSDHPDYHPHLTIGYLKPGSGKKYVDMFKGLEFELFPSYIIYSKPDGNKYKIKINKI